MTHHQSRTRIVIVAGTRPEIIKLAPVVEDLRRYEEHFDLKLILTGQHRELIDQLKKCFDLSPDINLDLMKEDQSLTGFLSECLASLESVIKDLSPDLVIAQGDTSTVLASGLVAYYVKAPFAHVEAGLRSNEIYNPFPEEINRKLAGGLASIHFAPTPNARENLIREGIDQEKIYITGNTVVDTLQRIVEEDLAPPAPVDPDKKIIVITAHRRENFGEPLESICHAVLSLAAKHANVDFVYPVHPNPNVSNTVHRILSGKPNIRLVPPLDYFKFVALLKAAYMVLSDSGGVQEELPTLQKPLLILRQVTERPEIINAGCAKLVGSDGELIIKEVERLLRDPIYYQAMITDSNPFGDGKSSRRITGILQNYFYDIPLPEPFTCSY